MWGLGTHLARTSVPARALVPNISAPSRALVPMAGALALTHANGGFDQVHTAATARANDDIPVYSRDDIRATWQAVVNTSAAKRLSQRMPRHWMEEDRTAMNAIIGEFVEEVLQTGGSDRLCSISDTIRLRARGFGHTTSQDTTPTRAAVDECWASIASDYECSICLDVLAAPVILKCTHSFCGSCLQQHCEIKGAGVSCPRCNAPVESAAIYERDMDEIIARKVKKIPRNANTSEWEKKRNAYLDHLKVHNQTCAPVLEDASTTGHAAHDDHARFTDEIDYIKWAVFFVAAITAGILMHKSMIRRATDSF